MPPLSNLATRDVETLVHPYTNLAGFRDSGPLIVERGQRTTGQRPLNAAPNRLMMDPRGPPHRKNDRSSR